jgi:hypothetical protein
MKVLIFFVALSIAATWPLADVPSAALPNSDDALFSVWRLAWVAHQLSADPAHLFDANIFHPSRGTLAHSDAMLALGLTGTPLLAVGMHPVTVHNVFEILAFVTAGFFGYLLCLQVTGQVLPAVVGGTIFAFSPYRFAHIGHLELLWTGFMPLSLWVLHKASPTWTYRHAVVLAAVFALQMLVSIYYGVFLALYLSVWIVAGAALGLLGPVRSLARWLLVFALIAGCVLAPYLSVYAQTRQQLGPRDAEEIASYSALPSDYLRVPSQNRLYPHGAREREDERSLFPGMIALVLAVFGVAAGASVHRWLYALMLAASFDWSLGVHGISYRLVAEVLPFFSSFRSPARFAALVMLSLAVLAALGAARAMALLSRRWRLAGMVGLITVCIAEYWSAPIPVRFQPVSPPPVYQWLAAHSRKVVLELPVPASDALWLVETQHQFMSIYHWARLVNGYSGYVPPSYVETLEELRDFPSPRSIRRLRDLGVDYVIVHERLYGTARFVEIVDRMIGSAAFLPPLSFRDNADPAMVFPLLPSP